jgi:hypothetical protein
MADTTPTAVPSTPAPRGMSPQIIQSDGLVRAQNSAQRSQVIADTLAANRTPLGMGADRSALPTRPITQIQNAE